MKIGILGAMGLAAMLPSAAWAWDKECKPQFTSYQQVTEQANKGNAQAQYWLGEAYFDGDNALGAPVQVDYKQARSWYDKAVAKKDACAAHAIGWMYDSGEGVAENKAEAFRWYVKAAKQGLPKSQYNVGVFYRDGEVVKTNLAEAKKWFTQAAKQGDAEAQAELDNWGQ